MPLERDPEGVETRYLREFVAWADARVLEVGAGEGRMTWRYAPAARRVVGIDPDVERLQVALDTCPPDLYRRVTLAAALAEALPFARETFHVAVLAWSL